MMRMSPFGRSYLQSLEACRLASYQDTNGTWTIGWGHTGHDVGAGMRWTQAEADAAFDRDLYDVEWAVSHAAPTATQCEFDAMCCLTYNIGIHRFLESTLLRRFKNGQKRLAAAEFGRWNKETINGKLVVNNGLTQRRAAERAMFNGGTPKIAGEKRVALSDERPCEPSSGVVTNGNVTSQL